MDRTVLSMRDVPYCCPRCRAEIDMAPPEAGEATGDRPCRQCGQFLWFLRKQCGNVVVLAFLPGLLTGSEPISRVGEIHEAIGPASAVVVNLSHLRFASSMFLSMLIALHQQLAGSGGQLKICSVSPTAREAFATTKLDTLFEIFDDEEQAAASFAE